jgi:hypothetical protein
MKKKILIGTVFSVLGVGLISLLWKSELRFPQRFPLDQSFKRNREPDAKEPGPFQQIHSVKKPFPNSLTQESANKIQILDEILLSKNDNDPRLDHDFGNLSLETKDAFINKYNRLTLEERNERGTIVFLLGKNIQSDKDLEFFQGVILESPCLSLSDCSKTLPLDSIHDESQQEITLVYPQLMALKSIERYLNQNPNSSSARRTLQQGMSSKSWVVRQMANDILTSVPNLAESERAQN